jgi:hypothetical protein
LTLERADGDAVGADELDGLRALCAAAWSADAGDGADRAGGGSVGRAGGGSASSVQAGGDDDGQRRAAAEVLAMLGLSDGSGT